MRLALRITALVFVSLGCAALGCGSTQSGSADVDNEGEVDVSAAPAPSGSSWRERFERRTPMSASRVSARIDIGIVSTDERTSSKVDKERAKKLYTEGLALMDAGSYAEASHKIAEAHALVPGALPLIRLSMCLEKAGDLEGACEVQRAAIVMLERDDARGRLPDARVRLAGLACP